MEDTLIILLSGAAGAAIIKLIDNVIQFFLQRKAKKEDAIDSKKSKIEDDLDSMKGCMKIMMFEHIRVFCEECIAKGYITIDERKRLHDMHNKYHGVGGNGDLDNLVNCSLELPFNLE